MENMQKYIKMDKRTSGQNENLQKGKQTNKQKKITYIWKSY